MLSTSPSESWLTSLLLSEIQGQWLTMLISELPTDTVTPVGRNNHRGQSLGSKSSLCAHSPPQHSNLLKGPVVVMGDPLHQVHLGAGDAADRSVPVVSDPHV